ncbi:hypothetical protein BDV41DRAFT_571117 [Aspergillus transmontanensis]|uniref:Uncharacterized protein n=1 Tax=Aspergillus transmontanensis TaxID=1034304 RepID=A0A5N6WGL1_9EURO|nr:hypothetical protein BDV41DRAFT_571117 [Aspergillus transmontanensis]
MTAMHKLIPLLCLLTGALAVPFEAARSEPYQLNDVASWKADIPPTEGNEPSPQQDL